MAVEFSNVSDIEYDVRNDGREFHVLRTGNISATLLRFKEGDKVPKHTHSDPDAKIILIEGVMEVTTDDGVEKTLTVGELYHCPAAGGPSAGLFNANKTI